MRALLEGRLTKEPEMSVTQSGKKIARLSIASNYKTKRQEAELTDFWDITAWDTNAERAAALHKGDYVCIEGEAHIKKWTARDGQNRQGVEIAARKICKPLPFPSGGAFSRFAVDEEVPF